MQPPLQPTLTEHQGRSLWRSMMTEVSAQQLVAPVLVRTLGKLSLLFILLGGALALSWSSQSLWNLVAAYVCIAMLLAQFAFVGHDCGHAAISRARRVNRTLGQISMTLVTGLAFDEWMGRHHAHHRFCQDETRDPDMAVDLMVSLTPESKRRKGRLGQLLTRYQAIHVWLLSLLFGHSQRLLSQVAALRHPHRYRLDAAILLLHFALWWLLPCVLLDVPWPLALLTYLIPLTLLGPYLAAIFWVNHIGMPQVDQVERFSFLEHQSLTSRTITNPPAWDWLFGGLNFQIEHHLFTSVPSHRLHAVQTIVRRHFADHGIAYQGVTWPAALRAIAAHLHAVARAP